LLRSVGQAAAEQQLLTEKVKKALRYPLIILSLALLVVMGMLCFVLPEFAAIYQTFNTPLPWLTRAVISIGEGLTRCWPLLLPGYFTCNTQPADLPAARLAAVPSEAAPYAAGVWQTAMRPAA
jgi:type II secretory pathway component PulF